MLRFLSRFFLLGVRSRPAAPARRVRDVTGALGALRASATSGVCASEASNVSTLAATIARVARQQHCAQARQPKQRRRAPSTLPEGSGGWSACRDAGRTLHVELKTVLQNAQHICHVFVEKGRIAFDLKWLHAPILQLKSLL